MISSASAAGEPPVQGDIARDISSIFNRKMRDIDHPRFSALKKAIWKDPISQSWAQVLDALKEKVEQVGILGPKVGNSIKRVLVCAKALIL